MDTNTNPFINSFNKNRNVAKILDGNNAVNKHSTQK